eukprot:TRINITY_DN1631_c1_g2_i1.p1 TRINITY_DN1631_c1_g2~~TRINITY_DN1631_c1_g2_i1.p1  ORF type:complete len:376 (+),score=122.89 TRINITY_DN1631_c1_g2_i1:58-1185(+)
MSAACEESVRGPVSVPASPVASSPSASAAGRRRAPTITTAASPDNSPRRRTPRRSLFERLLGTGGIDRTPYASPRGRSRLVSLVERSRADDESPHGSRATAELDDFRARTRTDVSEDCCVICFEQKSASATCACQPCGHEYHADCMAEFFQRCYVRECPICRAPIEKLRYQDGAVVSASELRERFRQDCFAIRFRKEPLQLSSGDDGEPFGAEQHSFFTCPEEIRSAVIDCVKDEGGGYVHRVTVPFVCIELLDSDGNPQRGVEGDDVVICVVHSSQNGTITPDTAMIRDGVAVFEQLHFEAKMDPASSHGDLTELLALKFYAQAPSLLVHRKAVYAGLYLKHKPCVSTKSLVMAVCALMCTALLTAIVVPFLLK